MRPRSQAHVSCLPGSFPTTTCVAPSSCSIRSCASGSSASCALLSRFSISDAESLASWRFTVSRRCSPCRSRVGHVSLCRASGAIRAVALGARVVAPEPLRDVVLDNNLRERLAEEERRVFANHVTHLQHMLLDTPEMVSQPSGWSLEIWRPFAARSLQDFALAIPPEQLFSPVPGAESVYGSSKQLLRRAMRDSYGLNSSAHDTNVLHRYVQQPGGPAVATSYGHLRPRRTVTRCGAGLHRSTCVLGAPEGVCLRLGRRGVDFPYVIYVIGLETWLRNLDAPRRRATTVATRVRSAPAVLLDDQQRMGFPLLTTCTSERSDSRTTLSPKGGETAWTTRASAPTALRA